MNFWNRWARPPLDYLRDPYRVALGAAIAGGFVLGMFYTAARFFDPAIHSFIAWAKEWQTLLTGVGAVGAAWWATRPVYRQLHQMNRQSAAMSVEAFRRSAMDFEAELQEAKKLMYSISACLSDVGAFFLVPHQPSIVETDVFIKRAIEIQRFVSMLAYFERRDDNLEIEPLKRSEMSMRLLQLSHELHSFVSTSLDGKDKVPSTIIRSNAAALSGAQLLHRRAEQCSEDAVNYVHKITEKVRLSWSTVRNAQRQIHD